MTKKIDGITCKYCEVYVTFKDGRVKCYSDVKDTYVVANKFYQIHQYLMDTRRTRFLSMSLDEISTIEEIDY